MLIMTSVRKIVAISKITAISNTAAVSNCSYTISKIAAVSSMVLYVVVSDTILTYITIVA